MDLEAEINHLKRRVGDLEGTVNLLIGQIGRLPGDLSSLQSETGRRFDKLEVAFERIAGRMDDMNAQVWSLRDDLPALLISSLRANRDS